MSSHWKQLAAAFGWIVALLCLLSPELAQACTDDSRVGQIQIAEGDVSRIDGISGEVIPLAFDGAPTDLQAVTLCQGDELRIGKDSKAFLYMDAINSIVQVDTETVLRFGSSSASLAQRLSTIQADSTLGFCMESLNRSWIWLRRGALRVFTTQPQKLDVMTQYLNASIEGTEFSVRVTPDRTRVDVTQGQVSVCNINGEQLLDGGESGESLRGGAPVLVNPATAVQWVLHFPDFVPVTVAGDRFRQALLAARTGDLAQAVALLDGETGSSEVALRSMIELVLNNVDKAYSLAQDAVSIDEQDPVAWLALSYTQQARFELGAALQSAHQASDRIVGLPDERAFRPFVHAREIEMLQVNGFRVQALESGRRLARAYPESARVQVIHGFLELFNYQLVAARRSFEAAMLLAPDDPMPRLGLSLINMRQGLPNQARLDAEVAVNLDPLMSLLRSYLARIYLQLGLTDQAAEQLELARALDSRDPLPWVFDAVLEQQRGNSTGALERFDEAAARVGFRGVYRSSVAQDTDLAVILGSRGRLYQELGFSRLTLQDAVAALQADPVSYVGLRLLADAYLHLPRHEFARQSAFFQAQVHQPLNSNPSQFRLSESRLDAFSDAGPHDASNSEYTRLFSREGVSGTVALLAESQNTRGAESQIVLLEGDSLLAVGGYRYATDGEGPNRDERLGIGSVFLQQRLDARNELQFEHREVVFRGGEDYMEFNRTRYADIERNREEKRISRISLSHRRDAKQMWLLNAEHGLLREITDSICRAGVGATRDTITGNVLDLQYVHDDSRRILQTGLLHTRQSQRFRTFLDEPNCSIRVQPQDEHLQETTAYAYLRWPVMSVGRAGLGLLSGLSFDSQTGRAGRREESLQPKLGISWSNDRMGIRAAAFRATRRSLLSARSLEPSEVMGFPQMIDLELVDRTELIGVGLDRTWKSEYRPLSLRSLRAGAQASFRRTDFLSFGGSRPILDRQLLQAHLYASFSWGALSAQWSWSEVEKQRYLPRSDADAGCTLTCQIPFSTGTTQGLDLGFRRQWSASLTSSLDARWRSQEGDMWNTSLAISRKGKSRFGVIDIALDWTPARLKSSNQTSRLTLGIQNLLDQSFNFEDEDPFDPQIAYEQRLSLRFESRFQ